MRTSFKFNNDYSQGIKNHVPIESMIESYPTYQVFPTITDYMKQR